MAKQQLTWTNEKRKLRDLAPWEHNPRYIKDAQAERLLESFNEFGQVLPICIGPDGEIYDGHQRRSVIGAADEYGLDYEIDVRVASRKLSERERQKLTVYLHQGATGQWDWDALADSFDFDDLVLWGFDEDQLLGMGWTEPEEETEASDAEAQISRADELQAQWQTATGQLWRIGEHRLICGDCTDADIVARVMDGKKADMMFTDPPYGVDYSGGIQFLSDGTVQKNNREKLAGDADPLLYGRFLPVVLPFVDGPCYMWFSDSVVKPVYDAVIENKCEIHALIIWHKTNATYAAMNAQYKQRHEPCLYFKPKGSTLRWVGPTDERTVWEIKRDAQNEFHPTQKPIELSMRAIGNHNISIVADFFAGSGSTIVGAQNSAVKCRAVELLPSYCAVILQRMQDAFPSIEIELLS